MNRNLVKIGDGCIFPPTTTEDLYKLFSYASIESIHNYYGCYGLSEITLDNVSLIDIYYNYNISIEICYTRNRYTSMYNASRYRCEKYE